MATTAIPIQTGPAIVNLQAAQQPQQQLQHQQPNLSTIKNLAVTQLIIGVLCVGLGIGISTSVGNYYAWMTKTAAGFWAGGWIIGTGIIGIQSTNVGATNKNTVYLVFSVISTCASAVSGLFFIFALIHITSVQCYIDALWVRIRLCNPSVGLGLFSASLILMLTEFVISIFAAVYSCRIRSSKLGYSTAGVLIQPAQPTVSVVTTGQGGTFQYQQMAPTPYAVSVAQPYNQYPPPPISSMPPQYPGQPIFVQAQPYQMPAQTNVAYSEKPPDYTTSGTASTQN